MVYQRGRSARGRARPCIVLGDEEEIGIVETELLWLTRKSKIYCTGLGQCLTLNNKVELKVMKKKLQYTPTIIAIVFTVVVLIQMAIFVAGESTWGNFEGAIYTPLTYAVVSALPVGIIVDTINAPFLDSLSACGTGGFVPFCVPSPLLVVLSLIFYTIMIGFLNCVFVKRFG